MQGVSLPKYIEKAITSKTAKSSIYKVLSEEQWRDLARHIYDDELIVNFGGTFFPRGNSWAYGKHGIKSTLDGLLTDAISKHQGVEKYIPHLNKVRSVFNAATFV